MWLMVHSWALALTMVCFAYAVDRSGRCFSHRLGLPLLTRLRSPLDCSGTFVDNQSVGACLCWNSVLHLALLGLIPGLPVNAVLL